MQLMLKLPIYKLLKAMTNYKSASALTCGVLAGFEHDKVLLSMKCGTIIDIGANKGQFSLISRILHPFVEIYAPEPLAQPYSKMTGIFKSDRHFHSIKKAIGSKNETAVINVSKADDSSSILEISAKQTELYGNTGKVGEETIEVVQINTELEIRQLSHPILVKLQKLSIYRLQNKAKPFRLTYYLKI